MTPSRGRAWPRRIAMVAIAATIPVLAGCAAGEGTPIHQWHQPTPGDSTQAGNIAISNVFVLGPPSGSIPAGKSASLFMALANQGPPDRLVSVSAPGTATSVKLAGGSVNLPSQKVALLTGPTPKAVLTGLTRPLAAGGSVKLTLTFQNAGNVHLDVPVMPSTDYFSTFSPAPAPSSPAPSPTPSTSGG